MKNTGKAVKDESSSREKVNLGPIIVALIAFVGVLCTCWANIVIQKSKENHEIHLQEMENAYEQKFNMSEKIITKAGIEYIRYEISTDPAINGFHVIPYTYIVIEVSGEKKYIPVEAQFLQEEYVAEQDGNCILYRENTIEELMEALGAQGCESTAECMVAIEYVVEGKSEINVYELRTGQLKIAEEEKVIVVVRDWENLNYMKIDMMSWPVGSEEQVKQLLQSIGYSSP